MAATFNAQLGVNESRHWPAMAAARDAQPSKTLNDNNVTQWLLRFTPSSACPEIPYKIKARRAGQRRTSMGDVAAALLFIRTCQAELNENREAPREFVTANK